MKSIVKKTNINVFIYGRDQQTMTHRPNLDHHWILLIGLLEQPHLQCMTAFQTTVAKMSSCYRGHMACKV